MCYKYVSIICSSAFPAPQGFSLAPTQEEFCSVESKTKHFLEILLYFMTSTFLLPKTKGKLF